jgi:molybdopterin converting factor small subunit
MTVRIVAFARIRELLGFGERDLELPVAATVRDAWRALAASSEGLPALAGSTRLARNGSIVDGDVMLADGDELALLPPVSGG